MRVPLTTWAMVERSLALTWACSDDAIAVSATAATAATAHAGTRVRFMAFL